MKTIYKYPTGGEIPDGAIYLCTQAETRTTENMNGHDKVTFKRNALVWHYFLVEIPNA